VKSAPQGRHLKYLINLASFCQKLMAFWQRMSVPRDDPVPKRLVQATSSHDVGLPMMRAMNFASSAHKDQSLKKVRRVMLHIIQSIEQLLPDNPNIGRAGRLPAPAICHSKVTLNPL
jgi:hypothetical protein